MLETTGKLDFCVGQESFQTWYKIVGDLTSGNRPIVVLHGGPGMSYNYLLPHVDIHTLSGAPVIFYDQIGIGQSTHLQDKPKEFWTNDLFMDELDNLLTKLGIDGDYDLLGHSWGGMLAAMYAATRRPSGLRHLVLCGTPASMELWVQGTNRLLDALPSELREMLKRHEREGTTESEEYQEGMVAFYKKHACTVVPWPEDLLASVKAKSDDPTVYHIMNGPSEFFITGTIKTWSVIDKLSNITYPTLIMNSVNDEAQDVCIAPFFKALPRVKWVQFAKSSHMPFWEERERYFQVVYDFLSS